MSAVNKVSIAMVAVQGSAKFTLERFASESVREFEQRIARRARMCNGDMSRLHRAMCEAARNSYHGGQMGAWAQFTERFNNVVFTRERDSDGLRIRRGRIIAVRAFVS